MELGNIPKEINTDNSMELPKSQLVQRNQLKNELMKRLDLQSEIKLEDHLINKRKMLYKPYSELTDIANGRSS